MKTVTGIVLDAAGQPVHCVVQFVSRSTPLFLDDGDLIGNSTIKTTTNAADGSFSVGLEDGNYDVTYYTRPSLTRLSIAVQGDADPVAIEELTTSSLVFVGIPPNTVWNERFPLDKSLTIDGEMTVTESAGQPVLVFRYNDTNFTLDPTALGGGSGATYTASRALVSSGLGIISASAVTSTEIGYLSGVTSAVQTQITGKVAKAGDTMTGALAFSGTTNPGIILSNLSTAQIAALVSPLKGTILYDTTLDVVKFRTPTGWVYSSANPRVLSDDDGLFYALKCKLIDGVNTPYLSATADP